MKILDQIKKELLSDIEYFKQEESFVVMYRDLIDVGVGEGLHIFAMTIMDFLSTLEKFTMNVQCYFQNLENNTCPEYKESLKVIENLKKEISHHEFITKTKDELIQVMREKIKSLENNQS